MGFCSHPQCHLVLPHSRLAGFPCLSPRLRRNLWHGYLLCAEPAAEVTAFRSFLAHTGCSCRQPKTEGKALLFAFTATYQVPLFALCLNEIRNCTDPKQLACRTHLFPPYVRLYHNRCNHCEALQTIPARLVCKTASQKTVRNLRKLVQGLGLFPARPPKQGPHVPFTSFWCCEGSRSQVWGFVSQGDAVHAELSLRVASAGQI